MNNIDAMKFVGERVKEMREKRGMSQTELAFKLGYKDKTSICRIENGLSDIPRSRLPQFAEALGVDPMYFVSAQSEPFHYDFYIPDLDLTIIRQVEEAGKMDKLVAYAKFLISSYSA